MRILVLGGTVFLSREVAAAAVDRGHEVVCACRGESGAVPAGAELVRWDWSEEPPAALADPGAGAGFDAVVQVGRLPGVVARAVALLPDAHHLFVSSVSAYADDASPAGPGQGVLHPALHQDLDLAEHPAAYGPMKVACEEVVRAGAARATVVRPGLIVGPGDPTGRFTYWAERLAAAGAGERVLAPGSPEDVVQVIDVRDLAAWIVALAERGTTGTYDAVGEPVRIADLLAAAGTAAELVWVDAEFLAAHGVEPWAGPESLPLWLPRPAYDGMLAHDPTPAIDAGLALRPLAETFADTAAWLGAEPGAVVTGLSRDREGEVLAEWAAAAGPGSGRVPEARA
ncbi:NAD-dependent epimerase/dehydratase family protein [Nocardioides sp. GY 10113]|uniref:NAD-dependent epimerase/dehydratase family protein n=1 Tax=Nocardioides sp. GY 10113 TaxID=2569761 RepID=UPI0010A91B18|nr:NAD-dependent epimerase/dehydratase family protein [Nocardioides sp. GY 10113]TIC89048.1 NAD-dependent epimerase/dehydratase family protein [Nocardioides sp. GY 10113]